MDADVNATLSQRGRTYTLASGENAFELAEGVVVAAISAPTRVSVYLDDEELEVTWRAKEAVGLCQFDLTNQVGFHRVSIRVGPRRFHCDFATVTAKATADEVIQMAEWCCNHYFSYRRQFTYVSRSGEVRKIHLPQIHYAWLRDRLDEVVRLAQDVDRRPALEGRTRFQTSPQGRSVSLPAMSRLLRERTSLLEEGVGGPIHLRGSDYWPGLVRTRQIDRVPRRIEHAQIAVFLNELAIGARLLSSQLDADAAKAVAEWRQTLATIRSLRTFAPYMQVPRSPFPPVPTDIQRTDGRYRRLRDLRAEYLSDIAPTEYPTNAIRANVRDIWEIYQTFVAHAVGNALGLRYCDPRCDLRKRDEAGASMIGDGFSLHFDSKPPLSIVRSWREDSARPGNERPDIFVVDYKAKRVLLLDAKFRVGQDGVRAKGEDVFEMQGYLNSFDVQSGGVMYPGRDGPYPIRGGEFTIAEIPIRSSIADAFGGVDEFHAYLSHSLKQLWSCIPASTGKSR